MDKPTAFALAVSGVLIVSMAATINRQTEQLSVVKKKYKRLHTYATVQNEALLDVMKSNPDLKITKRLSTTIDAFLLMDQNNLI
jgi:hypothetical protein